MEIKSVVSKLIKKFNTRDPFSIAKQLDIQLLFAELSSYYGCYIYLKRHRCIIINNQLSPQLQRLVMAHELGHAILHKKVNCYFMRNKTLLNTTVFEREANTFSAYLLISDDEIEQCNTIGQLSSVAGVPEEIVKLRLK